MNISTMITKNSVTLCFDGQTHTILASDSAYPKILAAIREKDEAAIKATVNRAVRLMEASKNQFTVVDGKVMVDNEIVPGALGETLMAFLEQDLPFEPLVRFTRKLRKNPSQASIDQLFSFLEVNKHPITENGNFIAYKKVRPNMLDIHSGTFDNSVGRTLTMDRDLVNPDPTVTCSTGLHVANWDYACNSFGSSSDTMIEVEVDPADVVAVPIDYNQGKMRTCKYFVRGIVQNPNPSKYLVESDDDSSDDSWDDESYDDEEESNEDHNDDRCEDCGQDDCEGVCFV